MQAAPVAPMPMAAFEAYASKAAIGVGATGAIGCSAQRSSCGVARVGGEKWGVRFHVFPNSDGSPLKWDTPHINQPINQGFLVLGWDMELLKPRFEWLPTPVLLGTLPAGVPAPACQHRHLPSSRVRRPWHQLGSQHGCSSTNSLGESVKRTFNAPVHEPFYWHPPGPKQGIVLN